MKKKSIKVWYSKAQKTGGKVNYLRPAQTSSSWQERGACSNVAVFIIKANRIWGV